MNARVVLTKKGVEKVIEIVGKRVTTSTDYKTAYDAEGVYSNTKGYFAKRGWGRKAVDVVEDVKDEKKVGVGRKFLGHFVRNDGSVGE